MRTTSAPSPHLSWGPLRHHVSGLVLVFSRCYNTCTRIMFTDVHEMNNATYIQNIEYVQHTALSAIIFDKASGVFRVVLVLHSVIVMVVSMFANLLPSKVMLGDCNRCWFQRCVTYLWAWIRTFGCELSRSNITNVEFSVTQNFKKYRFESILRILIFHLIIQWSIQHLQTLNAFRSVRLMWCGCIWPSVVVRAAWLDTYTDHRNCKCECI